MISFNYLLCISNTTQHKIFYIFLRLYFPFTRLYEYCTRDTWETYEELSTFLTDDKEDDYWCATVKNVDENDYMTSDSPEKRDSRAFCTEYHYPPDTGCPETYEQVQQRNTHI